jgi:hypothetical protein
MATAALHHSFRLGLRAACRRLALFVLLVCLPACSSLGVRPQATPAAASPPEATPTATLDPSYLSWIAARLKSFKKPPSDAVELSEPRWLLSNNGWSWLACVRFQDQGYRRTYVIYFDAKQVLDGRFAVLSDHCDAQTYTPFDLATAKLVPQAIGTQGPVY